MLKRLVSIVLAVTIVSVAGLTSTKARAGVGGPPCDSSFNPYSVALATLKACNLHIYPRTGVHVFPDGGHEYDYVMDGRPAQVWVPPDGFNPLIATDAELARYHIPPRPTTEPSLTHWKMEMQGTHFVTPPENLVGIPDPLTHNVGAAVCACGAGGDGVSPVWSGYIATDSRYTNPFSWVHLEYNELNTGSTPCSGSSEVTWAGMGGDFAGYIGQAGTAINLASMAPHQGWYEYYPGSLFPAPITGYPGYRFYVTVSHGANSFSYYLKDSKTNNAYSTSLIGGANSFDGSTAEFIVERPSVDNNPTPLANFYYANLLYAEATDWGTTKILGNLTSSTVTMMNGPDILAHPGSIYNSGQAFNDYYDSCL